MQEYKLPKIHFSYAITACATGVGTENYSY